MGTPERRLLDDVLASRDGGAWREALRQRCRDALRTGDLAEHALLDDVLADADYDALRADLRASLRARARRRAPPWRMAAAAIVVAGAAAAVLVALGLPTRTAPVAPPTPARGTPETTAAADEPPRSPARAVRPRVAPRVAVQAMARVAATRPVTRVGSRPRAWRPASAVIADRVAPASPHQTPWLSDERLLALLPPCGLVRRGRAWDLHFLDPTDAARLVVTPTGP